MRLEVHLSQLVRVPKLLATQLNSQSLAYIADSGKRRRSVLAETRFLADPPTPLRDSSSDASDEAEASDTSPSRHPRPDVTARALPWGTEDIVLAGNGGSLPATRRTVAARDSGSPEPLSPDRHHDGETTDCCDFRLGFFLQGSNCNPPRVWNLGQLSNLLADKTTKRSGASILQAGQGCGV